VFIFPQERHAPKTFTCVLIGGEANDVLGVGAIIALSLYGGGTGSPSFSINFWPAAGGIFLGTLEILEIH